jgi:peptidoglycan/LPS O-acetylase OafA/YrhL
MSKQVLIVAVLVLVLLTALFALAMAILPDSGNTAPTQTVAWSVFGGNLSELDGECETSGASGCPSS